LLRNAILHLRFPFVYVLSPIYVWGAYSAPGPWTGRTTLGFALVHLLLYPGANAFNSAYDRDAGPIGGLAEPPDIPAGMERWSTMLQAVGAALAPLVGWTFAAAYVGLWLVFTAYSHPRIRWKRSRIASLIAIAVGQGGLGWTLGWSAAGGSWPLGETGGWSLAAAVAVVAAMYPLTQVYQLEADAARGERTLAARLGVRGTLVWAGAGFLVLAAAGWAIDRHGLAVYGLAVALGAAVVGVDRPGGWIPSYRCVMTVAYVNATFLLLFMIATWR
jgi:1,4-dihydroxy-2-naphthoate octaprenyltransferase